MEGGYPWKNTAVMKRSVAALRSDGIRSRLRIHEGKVRLITPVLAWWSRHYSKREYVRRAIICRRNTWMGDKGAGLDRSLKLLASFVFVLQLCLMGEYSPRTPRLVFLLGFESGL